MTICRHVYYAGQVQGVGFRYTAQALAGRAGVAGFVRNLPDRRVELVAEGPKGDVERFLESLRQAMDGYIESARVRDETPQGYADFQIIR
jgi:acylphosphatase